MNGEQTMQFEGKTVDHAVELACQHFQCSKDELEITIITKGSTGLFGLGGKKAKIEVSFKGDSSAPSEIAPEEETVVEERVPEQLPSEEADEVKAVAKGEEAEGDDVAEETISQELLDLANEILGTILSLARLEGRIVTDPSDTQFPLKIEGEDASLIIGKEGQTLDALEYLINRAIQKRNGNKGPHVHIDAQGYREKRIESLKHLALRSAKKAKSSGRQVVLQPMSPRDRRIIHITLKEFHGVTTKSVGEGSWKKVVILPRRKRGRSPHRTRFNG